jgi:hypothetical protein
VVEVTIQHGEGGGPAGGGRVLGSHGRHTQRIS